MKRNQPGIWLGVLSVSLSLFGGSQAMQGRAKVDEPTAHILGDAFIGEIPEYFTSFTLDWHRDTEEIPAWFNSSMLEVDLSDQRLRALAKGLSPAMLRLGGSEGDVAVYDLDPVPTTTYQNETFTCPGPFCLTMKKWTELVTFCRDVGCQVIFGLNAINNKGDREHPSPVPWDPSNTEALLQWTAAQGEAFWGNIYGFEMGNELWHVLSPTEMASEFHTLRAIIDAEWKQYPKEKHPKIIGPDIPPNTTWLLEFTDKVQGSLDEITYHHYDAEGTDPTIEERIPTASFLAGGLHKIRKMRQDMGPDWPLWIGEGAAAWHSGRWGTTNAWASCFWTVHTLGYLGHYNFSGIMRQTLIGGYYELVDKDTFDPNPDYWASLLWNQVMGSGVFNVSLSDSSGATPGFAPGVHVSNSTVPDDLYVFSHCAKPNVHPDQLPGAIALAVVNANNLTDFQEFHVSLNMGKAFKKAPMQATNATTLEYILSSGGTNSSNPLQSRTVKLNGQFLRMQGNELPPLLPVKRSVLMDRQREGGEKDRDTLTLKIAKRTIGFYILPIISPLCQ